MTIKLRYLTLYVTFIFALAFWAGMIVGLNEPRQDRDRHAWVSVIRSKSLRIDDVQHALNRAEPGDVVELPAGTAKWTNIFLRPNVMLRGYPSTGFPATIIEMEPTNSSRGIFIESKGDTQ